jgi:hypothetical protein
MVPELAWSAPKGAKTRWFEEQRSRVEPFGAAGQDATTALLLSVARPLTASPPELLGGLECTTVSGKKIRILTVQLDSRSALVHFTQLGRPQTEARTWVQLWRAMDDSPEPIVRLAMEGPTAQSLSEVSPTSGVISQKAGTQPNAYPPSCPWGTSAQLVCVEMDIPTLIWCCGWSFVLSLPGLGSPVSWALLIAACGGVCAHDACRAREYVCVQY